MAETRVIPGRTVEWKKESGRVMARFEPAIELPVKFDGKSVTVPEFYKAASKFLRTNMPEYVDTRHEHGQGNPEAHVIGNPEQLTIHQPGKTWLVALLKSSDGFVHSEARPGISIKEVTLEGSARLPAIASPTEGKVYTPEIDLPIISALLLGTGIDFHCGDARLRSGLNWASPISFVKISDPTLARVEIVLAAMSELNNFMQKNMEALQKSAVEVADGINSIEYKMRKIRATYRDFDEACRSACGDLGIKCTPSLEPIVQAYRLTLTARFSETNKRIRELHERILADCPQVGNILEYASNGRTGEIGESSFTV